MTRTLVCAPGSFDPQPVLRALEPYALETAMHTLRAGCLEPAAFRHAGRAILVLPDEGMVSVAERVSETRRCLADGTALWVCCPRVAARNTQALMDCGASAVVTPRDWTTTAVAERLLAEFIVAGEVQPAGLGTLCGATEAMRELYRRIETVAPLSEPILILGETGTGKELVAREIHQRSRQTGSFMPINCAALTPELLESELFGHERGAFSSADVSRRGLLIEAGKGTVFLDEIGDLAPSAQAKLLRVLEEKSVRPVGSNRWHDIEARILLATNRNLEQACRERQFRQDLYERIRGFALHLPPLRQRKADLGLLARRFVDEYNQDYAGTRSIPVGALDPLFRYDWPGNVRELRQAARQAAAYAPGPSAPISVLQLLESVESRGGSVGSHAIRFDPVAETWRQVHDRVRAAYFRAVLDEAGGNKDDAAKRAGMSRSQLYEILRQISGAADASAPPSDDA